MKWNVSDDQTGAAEQDTASLNAALYEQLQAKEGTWFDLDLSEHAMPNQVFAGFVSYVLTELAKLRGSQLLDFEEAKDGKPYRVRITSGLSVPR